MFVDREDCLLAVLNETSAWVEAELVAASLGGFSWRERVRVGLSIVLSFLDREPELARLCVVGSARGGQRVLVWREQILAQLIVVVDEGRLVSGRAAQIPALTAEGTVGAVLAVVQRRLLDNRDGSLSGLLNELTSMVVLPYLGHAKAARELKQKQPSGVSRSVRLDGAGRRSSYPSPAYHAGEDPLADIPMRLTYRTARVLEAIAAHPGSSNRFIGEHADIHDQGQVSKLLARLKGLGLLANSGNGHAKGEANAWQLTDLGERVTEQLSLDTDLPEERA